MTPFCLTPLNASGEQREEVPPAPRDVLQGTTHTEQIIKTQSRGGITIAMEWQWSCIPPRVRRGRSLNTNVKTTLLDREHGTLNRLIID
jgi:hypothetical protein